MTKRNASRRKEANSPCVNHQPNVKNAPKPHPRSNRSKPLAWMVVSKAIAPFGRAAKVVANGWVGLGAPLTVTVGTLVAGEGGITEGVADEASTVNLLEVACITP